MKPKGKITRKSHQTTIFLWFSYGNPTETNRSSVGESPYLHSLQPPKPSDQNPHPSPPDPLRDPTTNLGSRGIDCEITHNHGNILVTYCIHMYVDIRDMGYGIFIYIYIYLSNMWCEISVHT